MDKIEGHRQFIKEILTEHAQISTILVKMGVPNSDIVIGFHTPFKRQFTSYAVQ